MHRKLIVKSMQQRYYYKFHDGDLQRGTRGFKMMRFQHSAYRAELEAQKYCKKMGGSEWISDPNFFAGGVSYLIFADERKVNTNVWRKDMTDDGNGCYVPNVCVYDGMAFMSDKMQPSNTRDRIYSGSGKTFDEIKGKFDLQGWAKWLRLDVKGLTDEEITSAIRTAVSGKKFYSLMRLVPAGKITEKPNGKKRYTQNQMKALSAERMRLSLPVVPTSRFYEVVGADLRSDANQEGKKKGIGNTPTFFHYFHNFYIALDYPCNSEDMKPLSVAEYMQAQRDFEKFCKDNKETK